MSQKKIQSKQHLSPVNRLPGLRRLKNTRRPQVLHQLKDHPIAVLRCQEVNRHRERFIVQRDIGEVGSLPDGDDHIRHFNEDRDPGGTESERHLRRTMDGWAQLLHRKTLRKNSG